MGNGRGGRTALAAAWLAAATAAAFAQDQQLGARTKAMGGSYTAFEDDPVSIWLNPAGIATQPNQMSISYQTYTTYPLQRELSAGGTAIEFSAEARTTFVDPALLPSYLGFVFQLGTEDLPMAVGICYARPYHLNYSFDRVEDPLQQAFVPDTNVEESFSRFRAAFAIDFRRVRPGEAGFLTHVAFGAGADLGYERWEFDHEDESIRDTATAPGGGGGILVGLYDNGASFKLNFGAAYQSAIRWKFNSDPRIFPAFDMPQQVNVGLTGYFFEGSLLRATVDLQWVDWSATAEKPTFIGQPSFEDAVNYSVGLEYRFRVAERVNLYPRAGFRRFQAPWDDEDNLPMTSNYKLLVDTDGSRFNIFTAGLGLSWTDARGKNWALDAAMDVGGDSFNLAFGFTYEL
jgi:long-subunit fatty acid transport protein